MRKKFRARTICLLCCWLAVSVFAGILFPQTAAISESDPAVSQDILEKNAEAASESDPASPSGQEKGILPPLEETIGRAMPSLGEVLQRYPDSETRHEDGSETDLYLHVTEEEFAAVSVFLEQSGAVLADYQVAGSVMKARIQVNEGSFGLEYDSGRQQIEVQFPAGTYDTRLKSARTHLAAARELYAEGREAEARKELEKIPQAEAYAPAAKPFEGIQKKEQEPSGSETAATTPEEEKCEAEGLAEGFWVVLGSFKNEDNARYFYNSLSASGAEVELVKMKNGFTAVMICHGDSYEESYRKMLDFYKNEKRPEDIWIYNTAKKMHIQ